MSALNTRTEQQALLMIMVATAALSVKGIIAKFVYASGTDITVLLLLRFGVAVPLFWIWYGFQRSREQVRRQAAVGMSARKQVGQLLITSGLFFAATYADFQALLLIDAGLSRLILFTFPVFVVLFSAAVNRSVPGGWQIIALCLAYAGLVIIMWQGNGMTGEYAHRSEGIAWALLAAVSYAAYLMYSQRVMRHMSSALFSAASGSLILLFMVAFYCLQGRPVLHYSAEGAVWSVVIAIVCTVVPFLLMHEAIRRASVERASRVALAGPGMTLLFAWLLLDEALLPLQIVGCVITVAAIAWLEKLRSADP
ncbi:DMT family transporter [Aliamphritea hakodatensis]|uniref:DMT family transporter n=1 Tax=Aliamphritea hakodatensis TaxID=2895352 RepID=UPI0022FD49AE|nr:DMT family transporter [Aliamphritea hakodatensis]